MLKIIRENRRLRREKRRAAQGYQRSSPGTERCGLPEQEHRNHVGQYPTGEGTKKGSQRAATQQDPKIIIVYHSLIVRQKERKCNDYM